MAVKNQWLFNILLLNSTFKFYKMFAVTDYTNQFIIEKLICKKHA